MTQTLVTYGAMLLISCIGGISDLRTGLIPHWATLPPLVIGPLLGFAFGGLRGLIGSLLGILILGLINALFYRLDAMGGGDVKLFTALGALGGPSMGLEIELLSLSFAFFWGLMVLAYRGRLLRALGTSGQLVVNTFLPASRRRDVAAEAMTPLRIGAAIFAGTLLAVLDRALLGGLLS